MARLGDICTLVNGYAFKPADWKTEGLPIIRIQNLNDITAAFNYYEGVVDEKYIVNDGDLLFSWSGTPGTSFGAFFWKRGKGVLNQHIFNVHPVSSVGKEYLRYALNGNISKIIDKAHGGVGLQHITKKELVEIEIPLLSEDEQEKIVVSLDGVETLISLRKQQLAKMDELVKARFVELFGDTKSNERKWKTLPLHKVLESGSSVSYGIVQTGDDIEDGVPVFRPIDIAGGKIPRREQLKRTAMDISNQYSRTLLKGYELLITVRGSVGETFRITSEFVGCNVGRNIVPLRFDTTIVDYSFMQHFFAQEGTKRVLESMTKGIALQGLNMSEFREIDVIIPDMSLQQQFAAFVEQTDKSKLAIQQSLDKLETLKKSLMQKYFG